MREENVELGAQLSRTEADLASTLRLQQGQQRELERTREEVSKLVTSFEEKINLMQVENESLIEDIRATRAAAKRYRKKCQDIEKEKEAELGRVRDEEAEKLKGELDAVTKRETLAKTRAEELNETVTGLRKRVAEFEADGVKAKRAYELRIKELDDAVVAAQEHAAACEDANLTLKADVAELEQKKEEMAKRLGELKETTLRRERKGNEDAATAATLESERGEMMDYIVELEGKLDQAEKGYKAKALEFKKEIKELKESLRKESSRVRQLEINLNDSRKEVESVEKRKRDLEKETVVGARRHSEEIDEFQTALNDLKEELGRVRREREEAESTVRSEYETKLTEARRQSSSLETRLAEVEASRDELENELRKVRSTTAATAASPSKTTTIRKSIKIVTLQSSSSDEEESVFKSSTGDEVIDVPDGGFLSRPSSGSVTKSQSPTPSAPSKSAPKEPAPRRDVAPKAGPIDDVKKGSGSLPSSPASRARWEQVKTAVVSHESSHARDGSPKPAPGKGRVAFAAQKFGAGRFSGGGVSEGVEKKGLKRSRTFTPGSRGRGEAQSKKEMLLQWCQQKTEGYRDVNVTNFARSWNDGMAFCALIHHFFPSKIPFDKLKKENKAENFELAFRVAETEGGVPCLLEVEDMVAMEVPDWMSVMTYVSVIYSHLAARDRK